MERLDIGRVERVVSETMNLAYQPSNVSHSIGITHTEHARALNMAAYRLRDRARERMERGTFTREQYEACIEAFRDLQFEAQHLRKLAAQ